MKINLKVITNAKQQAIIGLSKNNYKVKLTKIAEKGKANQELIGLLSDFYKVSQAKIKIVKGLKSKNKVVEILE